MTRIATPGAAALASLVLAGCMIGPSTSDAGVSEAGPMTVGDQCTQVDTEFCSQAVNRCSAVASLSDCVTQYMAQCCVGSVCNRTSAVSSATVASCKAAIDGADCNAVVTAGLPGECASIPQM